MKRLPFPPKRGRPPDRPIEPEPSGTGPQVLRRHVSGKRITGFPGFPGFPRAFSPPPERGWPWRVLWEGPGPRVEPEHEAMPGRKGFSPAPGLRGGAAGNRKQETGNPVREPGLWRWIMMSGARPAPRPEAPPGSPPRRHNPGQAAPRPPRGNTRGKTRGGRSLKGCEPHLFGMGEPIDETERLPSEGGLPG